MLFQLREGQLAQDGSSASGNGKKLTFLLATPDVLYLQPPLVIAEIFLMATFFNTLSRPFFPVFILSHYSALQCSRRKSLRFFTLESESLYTKFGHQVKRSKYCQNVAFGSASRLSSSNLSSPWESRPRPYQGFTHTQRETFISNFIPCLIIL